MPDDDRFADERKLAELTREKREISKREKEINGKIRELEIKLKARWEQESCRGVPLSGIAPTLVETEPPVDATLSLEKQGFIKIVAPGADGNDESKAQVKAAICQALKDLNFGEYVTEGYNSRSVSSLAKEDHWDRDMPPELEGLIAFEPSYKIKVSLKKPKTEEAPESLAAKGS